MRGVSSGSASSPLSRERSISREDSQAVIATVIAARNIVRVKGQATPCESYKADFDASEFGICLCGWKKSAHTGMGFASAQAGHPTEEGVDELAEAAIGTVDQPPDPHRPSRRLSSTGILVNIYDIDILKNDVPFDVDVHNKEEHLSDEQFAEVFDMDREFFACMAKWRKQRFKKEAGLF